jgi:hypothetical protein
VRQKGFLGEKLILYNDATMDTCHYAFVGTKEETKPNKNLRKLQPYN